MTRVFARSISEKLLSKVLIKGARRVFGGWPGPRARGGRGVLAFRTKGETRRNARGVEAATGDERRATSVRRRRRRNLSVSKVISFPAWYDEKRSLTSRRPASHGTARLAPPDGRGADAATRRVAPGARAGPVRARARARALPLPRLRVARVAGRGDARARRSRLPSPASRRARVRLARRSIVQVANDDGSFAGVSPRRRRDPVSSSPPRGFPVSGFRARDRRRARGVRPPIPLAFARVRPARAHARAPESKLARGLSEEKRDSAGVVVRAAGSRARRWPK